MRKSTLYFVWSLLSFILFFLWLKLAIQYNYEFKAFEALEVVEASEISSVFFKKVACALMCGFQFIAFFVLLLLGGFSRDDGN